VAALDERLPKGDRRERVSRVPEGRDQKPALQTSSATVRSTRERPSAVKSIGLNMSVPTPASL
jgi:hypothetical protein